MAVEDEPIRWRIDQTGCQHQEITDYADLLLGYGDLTAWLNLIAPVKNSSHQMLSVNESDYSENQFQERIIIPIIHPTPVVSQGNWNEVPVHWDPHDCRGRVPNQQTENNADMRGPTAATNKQGHNQAYSRPGSILGRWMAAGAVV